MNTSEDKDLSYSGARKAIKQIFLFERNKAVGDLIDSPFMSKLKSLYAFLLPTEHNEFKHNSDIQTSFWSYLVLPTCWDAWCKVH